jgi:hypothetical protein
MISVPGVPEATDPLFPAPALLPLADAGGSYTPLDTVPGAARPFSATLGVPAPVEGKKHDTTASRWTEQKTTQRSIDGKVEPDTQPIVHTDT